MFAAHLSPATTVATVTDHRGCRSEARRERRREGLGTVSTTMPTHLLRLRAAPAPVHPVCRRSSLCRRDSLFVCACPSSPPPPPAPAARVSVSLERFKSPFLRISCRAQTRQARSASGRFVGGSMTTAAAGASHSATARGEEDERERERHALPTRSLACVARCSGC